MNASKVFDFLTRNTDLKGNDSAIKGSLLQLSTDSWWGGYETSLKHLRKRRLLESIRRDAAIKRVLDYLSDLTHGTQKR
jgi:hypothetical protein